MKPCVHGVPPAARLSVTALAAGLSPIDPGDPAKLRIKDPNSNLSCHKGGYISGLKSTSSCKSPEEFHDSKGFQSLSEATLKRNWSRSNMRSSCT